MSIDITKTLAEIINENPAILALTGQSVARLLRPPRTERTDGLSAQMTLWEFYERWFVPNYEEVHGTHPKTREWRTIALNYWKKHTGDPPMAKITTEVVNRYIVGMRSEPGIESIATINKYSGALMTILNAAGPATPKTRHGVGLMKVPPLVPKFPFHPDVTYKTPQMEELETLLRTIDTIYIPSPSQPGFSANSWWRLLYTFQFNVGQRTETLLALQWRDVQSRDGMLILAVPGCKMKMKTEQIFPLNRAARDILQRLPQGKPDDLIFPRNISISRVGQVRRDIARAAGISTKKASFHGIRRMVATYVDDAQLIMGHTSPEITALHYQSRVRKLAALERLRQPDTEDVSKK